MKTNLSDHFAIVMTCGRSEKFFKNIKYTRHAQVIYKRIFSLEDTNKTYDDFLNIFSTYYTYIFLKSKLN